MKTRITIDRWQGTGKTPRETWKDLITALVLSGYEVYGDEEYISFILGPDDKVNKEKESE